MKKTQRILIKFLLVLLTVFSSGNVSALGTVNQSVNIFKFQQKLAKNGNAYAQYKLATMYEAGIGVDADVEKARQWYRQSSAKGVKAASDRNTYLTVKEHGYNKAEHQAWLDGIKADAKKREVEAMHLLGQLYHHGIGVNKNLDKSLALLTYVNSSGSGNVDHEIATIQEKINTNKIAAENLNRNKVHNSAAVRSKDKNQRKQQHKKAQAKAKPLVDNKKLSMAEKRRRYEKVMAQIRLEQRKIDEQQAQVTGGDVASIDDEF